MPGDDCGNSTPLDPEAVIAKAKAYLAFLEGEKTEAIDGR